MRLLITAIGRRVQLINHLKEDNYICGVDNDELVAGRYFVDTFYKVPDIRESDYIKKLKNICKEEKIDAIIPLYEPEFSLLNRNRKLFSDIGTKIILSDDLILDLCLDKKNTMNFFKSIGVKHPKTYDFKLKEDIESGFPLILKPRNGMGSKGIQVIKNNFDLKNIELDFEEYIIQQYIKGREYTIDILLDLKGNIVSIVPRERIEVRSGEISKGKSVKNIELMKKVNYICQELLKVSSGLIGPINMQCIYDGEDFYFIEINPRFGGGVPLTIESGINYSSYISRMILGESISNDIYDFKETTMIRYDSAIYIRE